MAPKLFASLGLALYAAVMSLRMQGMSVLGGSRPSVGLVALAKDHPALAAVSLLLCMGATIAGFSSNTQLRKAGLGLGIGALVVSVGFILFQENGVNPMQGGWVLSGVLLILANLGKRKAPSPRAQ